MSLCVQYVLVRSVCDRCWGGMVLSSKCCSYPYSWGFELVVPQLRTTDLLLKSQDTLCALHTHCYTAHTHTASIHTPHDRIPPLETNSHPPCMNTSTDHFTLCTRMWSHTLLFAHTGVQSQSLSHTPTYISFITKAVVLLRVEWYYRLCVCRWVMKLCCHRRWWRGEDCLIVPPGL